MDIKLLVFDLDGTLIDTMGDYADKAAELILKYYLITTYSQSTLRASPALAAFSVPHKLVFQSYPPAYICD